ncbi:hypothetical protein SNN83_002004 [Cronobacter malonaticus]|nr:hypothetical protein [Cronobacter malonaticus]
MKTFVSFAFFFFLAAPAMAFSLEGTHIKLLCPQRGLTEVILHRYQHTQESWGKDHFETGGGHYRRGPMLLVVFANLDKMIYNQATGSFSFWYSKSENLVSCKLVSIASTFPVNIPYYRE